MSDADVALEEDRRPLPNRIGIVLLNIPAPGLGLLRVQRLRAAILLLLVPHVLLGLIILIFAMAPTLGFWAWAGIVLGGLALSGVAWTIAMTMSWRASRLMQLPGPWWSRWYGIAGALVLGVAIAWVPTDIALSYYHGFYTRSSSMSPTLPPGDHFLATMRPGALTRGDVVLVENDRGVIYVSRVAGLPGDRISLVDGVVFLNGHPVAQRLVRTEQLPSEQRRSGAGEARRLAEQFPGEASPHDIYDTEWTAADDYPETLIPPGHVFVLGDNRDNAADSRIPVADMGLAMVPEGQVRGRALYHSWRSSRPMGTPIGRN